MLSLNEIIKFEHKSEHVLEHDLAHKKEFSTPKIYIANGDLSKRWYVYFTFRDPSSGKLKRMKNIYGNVNTYKTKEDRMTLLSLYRRRLLLLLNDGYNPFLNNTELYQPKTSAPTKEKTPITIPKTPSAEEVPEVIEPVVESPIAEVTIDDVTLEDDNNSKLSLREAFDFSLTLKEKIVGERTIQDYLYSTER